MLPHTLWTGYEVTFASCRTQETSHTGEEGLGRTGRVEWPCSSGLGHRAFARLWWGVEGEPPTVAPPAGHILQGVLESRLDEVAMGIHSRSRRLPYPGTAKSGFR